MKKTNACRELSQQKKLFLRGFETSFWRHNVAVSAEWQLQGWRNWMHWAQPSTGWGSLVWVNRMFLVMCSPCQCWPPLMFTSCCPEGQFWGNGCENLNDFCLVQLVSGSNWDQFQISLPFCPLTMKNKWPFNRSKMNCNVRWLKWNKKVVDGKQSSLTTVIPPHNWIIERRRKWRPVDFINNDYFVSEPEGSQPHILLLLSSVSLE